MSTESDHAREIAERIARRVAKEKAPPHSIPAQSRSGLSSELAAVRAGLSDLQSKISQLEARLGSEPVMGSSGTTPLRPAANYATAAPSVPRTHSPWLAGVNGGIAHVSEERFGVEEAVVSELVDYFEQEKKCSLEPGDKPCDHCAMCSSRGF